MDETSQRDVPAGHRARIADGKRMKAVADELSKQGRLRFEDGRRRADSAERQLRRARSLVARSWPASDLRAPGINDLTNF